MSVVASGSLRSRLLYKLDHVLSTLEGVQSEFNNAQVGNKKVSLADLIVLGGCAAIEKAAKEAGVSVR